MFTYNIHPSYVTKSYKNHKPKGYANLEFKRIDQNSIKNLNKGFKQNSTISKTSINKIIKAVQWLDIMTTPKIYITKNGKRLHHKLTFITLTLPAAQIHSDKVIVKEILQKWLNNVRNNYGFRNYVYRAETQANGNIHFHLITDCNLNYYQTLHTWNIALSKLGYIARFKEINGHENPNSVDIKRVSSSKKIAAYIAKYLAKEDKGTEERRNVECRHYAMSKELSNIKDFNQNSKEIAEFAYQAGRNLPNVQEVKKDFCSYIVVDLKRLMGIFRDFKIELILQFRQLTKFKPSRTYLYSKYQPNQNKLIFIN